MQNRTHIEVDAYDANENHHVATVSLTRFPGEPSTASPGQYDELLDHAERVLDTTYPSQGPWHVTTARFA